MSTRTPLQNKIKRMKQKLEWIGNGLSLYDLAEKAGLNPTVIYRIYNGSTKTPTPETMDKIYTAYNVLTKGK